MSHTAPERALIAAVLAGDRLDLSESGERGISAELIRDILLGRVDGDPDPRGIFLRGAHLADGLDLTEVESKLPLRLIDCETTEPVRLIGAHLSTVDLSGLAGVSVAAQEATIDRSFTLRDVRLTGGPYPTINLGGCHVGGVLDVSRSELSGPAGAALLATNLRVGGGVFLNQGFQAEGTADLGLVRLSGAVIGGQLNASGARIHNTGGPALVADYLQTGSSLMLNDGFVADGSQDTGTVRLVGARIGGRLMCDGVVRADAPGHLALNLSNTRLGGDLLLPSSFAEGPLELGGLTYDGKARNATLDEWLEMLATRTTYYASQPYFQLAASHAGAGHERDVRRIHIARQKDLARRGDLGAWGRLWHRLTGLTVGYGYRPGRALLWLLGTLAAAIVLTAGVAGPAGLTIRPGQTAHCSVAEQVGLALNSATPLVKADNRCQIVADSALGQVILGGTWLPQVLTWAFLTLFVAGFTGLMRRQ